jgi:formate dehydrogenase subunit delta
MEVSTLVTMANQIADFWSPYPKAEAIDGISKHIHSAWEPRMRDALKAHIDKGGEGLSPLSREALADYFKGPKSPVKAAPAGKSANKAAGPA